jgi:hypothetical protein
MRSWDADGKRTAISKDANLISKTFQREIEDAEINSNDKLGA